jgi:hypothetical protein
MSKIKVFTTILTLILSLLSFVSADLIGSSEWNITINETGFVTNYHQINYSDAQFEVIANISATQYWAEVQLNTSEIDFGKIEKGDVKTTEYKIWSRGTVDINVRPELTNDNDNVFSNLYFSRTPSTNYKKIGEYSLRFNLTQNKSNWLGIGPSGMEPMKPSLSTNGKQYIKLDLSDFNDILPFDEQRKNVVKFTISPIWSSIEPVE